MSDDNVIPFPGKRTPEELEFFKKRSEELLLELKLELSTKYGPTITPEQVTHELMAKVVAVQVGLEYTMKTLIKRLS